MSIEFINPFTRQPLLESDDGLKHNDEIVFPVVGGAYRVVADTNYTENFGFQWNRFAMTQIDKSANLTISKNRLFAETNWDKEDLKEKYILEVGSGAGRFTQILLDFTNANIYSVDYSNAVEANYKNNGPNTKLKLFQASIYELPFAPGQFDKVICLGVLQHTPDVEKSIKALIDMAKPGAEVIVDFYPIKGWWTKLQAKYLLRGLTKKMDHEKLYKKINNNIDRLIKASQFLSKAKLNFLNRFLPICDIEGTMPKNLPYSQLRSLCVLDTFDMFSPEYDQPQKINTVINLFKKYNMQNVWGGEIIYDNGKASVVKGIKKQVPAKIKKTILHIIYNLGRGGAETMLVRVLKELTDYNNIVVTLFPQNHFKEELTCDKYYCLNLTSIIQIPFVSHRLTKIITENNADIVHSHLFWPTILARLGTPKNIPLITTIHAFIATSVEYKKWYIRWLDKFTYKLRKNIIITVAKDALDEYFSFLKIKPYKAYALHTFVDVKTFNEHNSYFKTEMGEIFRLVTVGALRKQKNHIFLLEAFKQLDNKKFRLDIYGDGPLRLQLEKSIKDGHLNVHLKGEVRNIEKIINQYDLFVMSSTFEGFSLSVLEAMAMKMPLLVSDIRSFREQCENTAVYYILDNVKDFTEKLEALASDSGALNMLGKAAHERAVNNFTLEQHMSGLRKIYTEVLQNY